MKNPILSARDREHFLENGTVVVKGAVPPDNLKAWQDLAWRRLGYDRDDSSTWEKPQFICRPRARFA